MAKASLAFLVGSINRLGAILSTGFTKGTLLGQNKTKVKKLEKREGTEIEDL